MTMTVPNWMRRSINDLERNEALDPLVAKLRPLAAEIDKGRRGEWLRGEWLGHALHPLLTDFPLGLWAGAGLLDLVGGRRSRKAAQRLVGLGLLFVPPTAAAGWAEWSQLDDARQERVGAAHAVGNTGVALLYWMSWRARRRDHHFRGVLLGMAGGGLAWITGYLGGHLSFARGVGTGSRGLIDVDSVWEESAPVTAPTSR